MSITVKDAAEIVRLNELLKMHRYALAQITAPNIPRGTMTLKVNNTDRNGYRAEKEYSIGGDKISKVVLGYVRADFEAKIADCIRRLNALNGEIRP